MTLLEQLKTEHAALSKIHIQPEAEIETEWGVGVRITYGIYAHIIRDALSTLGSLINYLETKT